MRVSTHRAGHALHDALRLRVALETAEGPPGEHRTVLRLDGVRRRQRPRLWLVWCMLRLLMLLLLLRGGSRHGRRSQIAQLHAHGAGFRVEVQRVCATLPGHSAVLHAAEGHVQLSVQPAVHPDGACIDAGGHAVGPAETGAPNRCRQAVVGAVCKVYRLVLAFELVQGHERAEHLFGHHTGAVREPVVHNHGAHPVATIHGIPI
mmetsp:Transcript_55282/g.147563  ORF Transcript_55282/g.147563 Transcript_55282/m.147563 type:complete len:205 (+) Transcript_55282:199-813(+)